MSKLNFLVTNLKFISSITSKFVDNIFVHNVFSKSLKHCLPHSIMEDVSKVWTGPLPPDSPYLKPFRFYYIQDGVEKTRDLVKTPDSVLIVLFNTTCKKLVFVRQFRPAVFYSILSQKNIPIEKVDLKEYPPKMGITLEHCAGMIDKEKSWTEIAREEILEECGYDVEVSRIEEVMTFRAGIGSHGAIQKMYYCEVADADKKTAGGGVDDEIIEVVEYTIDEAKKLVNQDGIINSPPAFLLGIFWFLINKAPMYGV